MKCSILCLYALLHWNHAPVADSVKISMQTVLASANSDAQLLLQNQAATYLANHPMYLPLFDKLEFRFGPDDLYFDEQRIAFRFSTNGFSEIKKQRALHDAELMRLQTEAAVLREEALLKRYLTLADAYFYRQLAQSQSRLAQLEDERSQIFGFLIDKGVVVDAVKLVEAEEDWQDSRSKVREWESKTALLLERIQQYTGQRSAIQLDLKGFVNVAQIALQVSEIDTAMAPTAELALKIVESRVAEAEWRVTLSSKFNVLNFVQIDYRDRPEPFAFERDFSARIGLNIPIAGRDKPKEREQALKWRLADNDAQAELASQQQQFDLQRSKVQKLIALYQADQSRWQQSAIRKLLANDALLAQLGGDDLLQLQIAREKQNLREIEQAYDITIAYVEWLQLSGALNTKVLRNYLSEGKEQF